jgi:hypothetical protein
MYRVPNWRARICFWIWQPMLATRIEHPDTYLFRQPRFWTRFCSVDDTVTDESPR